MKTEKRPDLNPIMLLVGSSHQSILHGKRAETGPFVKDLHVSTFSKVSIEVLCGVGVGGSGGRRQNPAPLDSPGVVELEAGSPLHSAERHNTDALHSRVLWSAVTQSRARTK